MTLRDPLAAFLEVVASTPFTDGHSDCALTVADWIVAATGGADPAEGLRGKYQTAAEREAMLKARGGLKAVMSAAAEHAGLKQTRRPKRGDVGLVAMSGQILAAICLGDRWAAKGDGLVVETPRRVLKAWSV